MQRQRPQNKPETGNEEVLFLRTWGSKKRLCLQGDVWAESSMLGFLWHYYACMDNSIYDITEWVSCQVSRTQWWWFHCFFFLLFFVLVGSYPPYPFPASHRRCRSSGNISFPGSAFCADSYFGIHSTHMLPQQHVKRSKSFCQSADGRLQLDMHTPYIYGFAWSDMMHGCMVYTEHAQMAAVSCGISHASTVSTLLQWIFKNAL